ncbi:MAG: Nramp family divalent metal transporter [Chloroflexi bacterium]|nr:Nramp family divalent metal transporter [Chloroflexota bacterium]
MSLERVMVFFKRRWRALALFLAVLGPGIITSIMDNDAPGITTYSVCGANYGYRMLWILVVSVIPLIIIQEMCIRMGIVTGKGLGDLIREKYGVKVTFFVLLPLLVANLGTTMAEFAGVAASCQILGISKYIAVPVTAFLVWWLVLKASYKQVERVFLFGCVVYFSYFASVIMARPDWGEVGRSFIHPSFEMNPGFIAMAITVIGTTIAPWMLFYIQASVVEKGLQKHELTLSRLDMIVGSFLLLIFAVSVIVACGAVLYPNGIRVETAKEAAIALRPLAGKYASLLFALGLLNSSVFAASILPVSTSYVTCESLGFEAGIDQTYKEAPVFYLLYAMLIILGSGLVLIPGLNLITVMLASQTLCGILLPFILFYILKLCNDKRLMGEYTNSKAFNIISWITIVIIMALTAYLVLDGLRSLI